ncbi:MAG TPA: hypothetical protein VL635_19110 [Trinickia sp.]|jgi:hypothetical protein|nr:hypothetical protein [Trinickia sp.]
MSERTAISTAELTVIMRPYDMAHCQYFGTRAILEAEGVIPADIKWPTGFDSVYWEAGSFTFHLRRERPDGAKGPRNHFCDCDYWALRWERTQKRSWAVIAIEKRQREIADILRRNSPAGRDAEMEHLNRLFASREDEKFQAFKARIPGLIPPPRKPRGRRPKVADQSCEEA